MLVFAWLILGSQPSRGQILYVDDSAGGSADGSSWCDALTNLQDALAIAAGSGGVITEIRVAQGIYKPDVGANQTALSRGSTFQLISGVVLRGGYAGCGAFDPSARNPATTPSVLTGDLAGNDVGDRFSPTRADNAYHVVTGSGTNETAILDGFTVTAGRANGAGSSGDGAGLYNDGGSPTVSNCLFEQNYAIRYGGAIRNWRSSSPDITNCRIVDNSGDYGGGINNTTQSSPIISGCEIARNTCGYHGGGVYNDFSSAPQLIGCTITGNRSYYNGGGVANYNQSHAALFECHLIDNRSTASVGGGMYNDHSSPTITDTLFEANQALFSAGGISNLAAATAVSHSVFRENHANYGGGMVNDSSSPVIHNCLFERNSAVFDGAGLYNLGGGTVTVTNSTFVKNTAGHHGGGIFNFAHNPVLTNVILWRNEDNGGWGELAQLRGGTPVVNHSCIEGWTGSLGGAGNQGTDPRFTSGPKGCYYLSQLGSGSSVQSHCVDAGSDLASAVTLDSMTTRSDSFADSGLVDVGFHYAIVNAICGPGNYACRERIDLRDFAHFQRCLGIERSATGVLCCEQFDVDGEPGVTLDDAAMLIPSVTDP